MKRGKLAPRGTCQRCKTEQQITSRGRIALHEPPRGGWRGADGCTGGGMRSVEACAPDRERARAERTAAADRVRHEAAVMLDALFEEHAAIDEQRIIYFRKLAFEQYRILYLRSQPDRSGIKWRAHWDRAHAKDRRVDLFCVFCGDLVATHLKPWWNVAKEPEHWDPVQRHVSICALQYLAGLRVPPPPGTCKVPTGQMSLAEAVPVGDGPLFGAGG